MGTKKYGKKKKKGKTKNVKDKKVEARVPVRKEKSKKR